MITFCIGLVTGSCKFNRKWFKFTESSIRKYSRVEFLLFCCLLLPKFSILHRFAHRKETGNARKSTNWVAKNCNRLIWMTGSESNWRQLPIFGICHRKWSEMDQWGWPEVANWPNLPLENTADSGVAGVAGVVGVAGEPPDELTEKMMKTRRMGRTNVKKW